MKWYVFLFILSLSLSLSHLHFSQIQLGGGGSGALVFRCSVKGFSFAAKIMRTNAQPEEVQPLVSEISIMMQLKHDNIVRIKLSLSLSH